MGLSSLDDLIMTSAGGPVLPDEMPVAAAPATVKKPADTAPSSDGGSAGAAVTEPAPAAEQPAKPKRTRKPKAPAEPPASEVPDVQVDFKPMHLSSVGGAASETGVKAQDETWGTRTISFDYVPTTPQTPPAPRQTAADPTPQSSGSFDFTGESEAASGLQPGPVTEEAATPPPASATEQQFEPSFDTSAGGDYLPPDLPPPPAGDVCAEPSTLNQAVEDALIAQMYRDFDLDGGSEPAAPQPAATNPAPQPSQSAAQRPATVERQEQPDLSDAPVPIADSRDELVALQLQRDAIRRQIAVIDQDTGICAYKSRDKWDRNNIVHEAIHMMRWEPHNLFTVSPQRLCEMEPVLASAQAYVQTQENYWQAEYDHLGRELDRIMFIRRESYKGDTKGAKENALLASDPDVRRVRNDYLMAAAIKAYLSGMGEAFRVLAYAIKRPIDLRQRELENAYATKRHTA